MAIALEHLGDLLDLRVDFGRADAHAAGIERRVRAAVDDHAAMLGPFGEIAMAPDIRESARNRRRDISRRRDRSRTRPASTGTAWCRRARPSRSRSACRRRPDVDRHAEAAAPGSRRARPATVGSPSDEARDDVGAARDRGQHARRCLIASIDVIEALRRKRRAGRGDHAASQDRSCVLRGCTPALSQRVDIFRRGAEQRDPLLLGVVEQHVCRRDAKGEPS